MHNPHNLLELFKFHLKLTYLLLLWFLCQQSQQLALQCFLVLCQPVLLPSVVKHEWIVTVTLHAALEE